MPIERSIPVPLIDRFPPVPLGLRRADIAAFWILTTPVVSLAIWGTAAWLGVPSAWAVGVAGAAVILVPGLVQPQWFERGVEVWNRMARFMTRAVRKYVVVVSYYILFAALGRAGSSLDISSRRPQRSRWLPLPIENKRTAVSGALISPSAEEHQTLRSWLRASDHTWAWCLLPITTLLLLLKDEQPDSAPPSGTYTLY